MTIKIVLKEGLYCPVIHCDYCNEAITDITRATYEWPEGESESGADIVFLHHRCVRAFQEGRRWYAAEPLEYLALRIATNAGQSPESLIATIREMMGEAT